MTEEMDAKAHTPTDTYRANIQKVQDELVSIGGLEEDTKHTIKNVAGAAIEAIDNIKKCNTIDALDGLLSVENRSMLLKSGNYNRRELDAFGRIQLSKQLHDIVLWTRNAIIYELHNTCECKDRA